MMHARRERGITLVTALIMLVLLTILALTSFNLGNSNLQVVSNMQRRQQALAAAHEALEETISTANFAKTPGAALPNPCGAANQRCIDSDGDGKTDIVVTLSPPPACVKVQPVKNSDLNLDNNEDLGCATGVSGNYGDGSANGNSDCDNTVWDLNAVATDTATQATVKVTQGVGIRISKDDVATNCPQPGTSP